MFQLTTATKKVASLEKRIKIIQGGTSASKTISILLLLIDKAQFDKKPTLTSICAESLPHLKRGAMRDFLAILKEHNYYNDKLWNRSDFTYTFETGSQIEFFGVDQPDKLRGARRDRLFINEANNVPFEAFEQLEVRTKEEVFIDFNPTNEFWAFTEIIGKRDDVDYIILTYKDNEALSQEIIDSLEQRMNRPGWWKVYGEGQLGEVEGKIYKGWQIIDELPHEARLERFGLDFGYTNDPTAIVGIYKHNEGYIWDEVAYQKGLLNKAIADIILAQPDKRLTVADSAEPKSIDEIAGYGVSIVGAEKGADSVRHRINLVQDQKISITKRSANIIHEYRNYLWKTDRNGKVLNEPEHQYSHAMDAGGYAMAELLKNKGGDEVRDFYARLRMKKQTHGAPM